MIFSWKDVLPEKDLLEKAATMKRFEYSSLGKELKNRTGIPKKQYQKLDNTLNTLKQLKKKSQHMKTIVNEI